MASCVPSAENPLDETRGASRAVQHKTEQKNIMKLPATNAITLALFAAGALCLTAVRAEEKEESVSIDKIPAAAAAALKSAAGGAAITGIELDDEDGKIKGYEAAFTVQGRKHEVAVTAEGTVYSKEEVIPFAEAPAAVKAAVEKKAAGVKIETLERAEAKGKVTYEAKVGATEYEFAEDGSFIGEEGGGKEEKGEKAEKD